MDAWQIQGQEPIGTNMQLSPRQFTKSTMGKTRIGQEKGLSLTPRLDQSAPPSGKSLLRVHVGSAPLAANPWKAMTLRARGLDRGDGGERRAVDKQKNRLNELYQCLEAPTGDPAQPCRATGCRKT
jgi:hypothetical protein